VYHGRCKCGTTLNVDGYKEGVLNMGTYLVSHRLLAEYMMLFLQAGFVDNI